MFVLKFTYLSAKHVLHEPAT